MTLPVSEGFLTEAWRAIQAHSRESTPTACCARQSPASDTKASLKSESVDV